MQMCDCPKFDGCNAPICPLDPDWEQRRHLDGEKACFYLTEYAKSHARPILRGCLAAELYETVAKVYPRIITRPGPLRRQLRRSSGNPARIGRKPRGATA